MQHRIINLSQEIDDAAEQPETELSFKPFLDYVRLRLKDQQNIKKEIYQLILQKFEKHPELETAISINEMSKYKELLNLLYMVLSSVVEDEKTTKWGLALPVTPQIFYGTEALYEFMLEAGTQKVNDTLLSDKAAMRRQKCEKLYSILLERLRFYFQYKNGDHP